ncbi:MAG TPA: hypothetical protein VJJ21_03305 [Candidatus Nanoarchaeia archaeon]|nr:hypothetical protein [Candidatus Nanoarchaeia archaeon]
MNQTTTIKLQGITKQGLDHLREYKNESYDEVIQKMLSIVKNIKKQPALSQEAIISIEKARERIKKGNFLTEEQARKRLAL